MISNVQADGVAPR